MGSKLRGFLFACLSVICVCSLFAAVGCKKDDGKTEEKLYTVTFDLCTDLQTTTALPRKVKAGMRIDEPKIYVTGDNPDNYEIEGWYSEKNYSEDSKWDFSFDSVESDVTLYAKWGSHKQYKVRFYKEGDEEATYIATIEQGLTASECDDRFGGYAVLGYYTSPEFDKEFDFEAAINADTDVFVKLSDYIYLSPKYLAGFEAKNNASCKLAADGSTVEITYETKSSFIYLKGLNLALNGRELIEIVYKLEGGDRADIYWFASDGEGKPVAGFSDFNEVTKSIGAKSFFTEITTDEEGWTHAVYDLTRPKGYADGKIGQLTDVAVLNGIRFDISGGSFPAKFIVKSIQGQKKPELIGNPVEIYVDGELKSTIGVENGEKAQKPADEELVLGRQIVGYYTDAAFTNEFDFNTPITKAPRLYAKTSDYMYFNGAMLDGFTAAAGATKTLNDDGTLSLKGNNGSFIHRKGLAIDINTGNCIEMKVKADIKLGGFFDFYIFGEYTSDGVAAESTDYGQANTRYRARTEDGCVIGETDANGYRTYTFRLSDPIGATGKIEYKTIKGFRIGINGGNEENNLVIEYVKSTGDGDVSEPEKYSVNYYVGERSVYSEKISKGDLPGGVPEKEFSVLGRQIVGYYTDAALTNAFDIANTAITEDTKLYIKTSDYLYFNGAMISKFAGGNVTGKTLNDDGTVTLTGKKKLIHQKELNLDLNGTNCIEIKAKTNVPKARVDIYLFGTYTLEGTAGESTNYGQANTFYRGITTQGWTVSEPDEEGYVIMRYNLAYTVDGAAAKDFSYSVIKGFRIDLADCETLTVEYVKSVKV